MSPTGPGATLSGELTGEGTDGSRSIRFHQSLTFTDGGSNHSEEQVRAILEVGAKLWPNL